MPLNPQQRPTGKKAACVLRRPPAPPPLRAKPDIAVVGSRVSRLLHDARASVQAQQRPDTPLILPAPLPLRHGSRLATMISAASSEKPQVMPSARQFDRAAFDAALEAAKGVPEAQMQRLGELKHWLANPHHVLWDTAVSRLVELVLSPSTDAQVALCAASVFLRSGDVNKSPVIPVVVRRLHELCEGGLEVRLLEVMIMRESLIQPLLQLLESDELLKRQPGVLWDVLETLRCCSANSDVILTQLVTLGMIPATNTLVKRILSSTCDTPSKARTPSDNLVHALLPPLCLLYRNLSTQYSHHLRKLGSLDLLVDILEGFRSDCDVVQAAARAMAKTVFDDCCLAHYQKGTRACRAVVAALEASVELDGLAISRLCGTLARLVEGSRELRDWLMHHHHQTLMRLVQRVVTPPEASADASAEGPPDPNDAQQGDLLQSVTWLVGVAAISAECSPAFVRDITPLLVAFLKDLDVAKWHLTFIYTLMCLSNLSFFFAALEKTEGGADALVEIYATMGLILAGVLFDGDTEATVEATRVLGNMSLTNAGRDWMESCRCDEVCVVFLGHEDPRIVYNCFGVLLNLTAADTCRVATDPELMHMLLQHTGRYTREDGIAAEKAREMRRRESVTSSEGEKELSYTDQIADVVEKLLLNLSGLV